MSKFVYGYRDPGNEAFRWVALLWRYSHERRWHHHHLRTLAPWGAAVVACRRTWRRDRQTQPWWFRRFQKDLPDGT